LGPDGAILPALFVFFPQTDSFIWAKGLFDSKQLPAWNLQFIAQGWRFASFSLTLREHVQAQGGICMIGADKLVARCRKGTGRFFKVATLAAGTLSLGLLASAPVQAQGQAQRQVRPQAAAIGDVQDSFDSVFGTEQRGPRTYSSDFGKQLA